MPIKAYQVKSKLAVAYVLQHTPETKAYLPDTEKLTKRSLKRMMESHSTVYLKADKGRKSRNILRVERKEEGQYRLMKSRSNEILTFDCFDSLWDSISEVTAGKKYIIQQGIDSVTPEGRSFDLRCHALRVKGEWVVGGICARVGKPGGFITTSHQGGTPTLMEDLFTEHLRYTKDEQEDMMERLHDCILKTVKAISPMYPNLKEFAVDIGIDPGKGIWIYEVNIEPLIRGNFKQLPTRTLYNRIRYLRTKAK